MTGINPIGGAGGGFDPDANRPKTPEERRAEIEERKKKWEEINRDVQQAAEQVSDDARKNMKGLWTDEEGRERFEGEA